MRRSSAATIGLAAGIFGCLGAATAQVTINVTNFVPASHLLVADVMTPLCRDIEQDSGGRIKCNMLAKAVVAAPQQFDAVRDGLADLAITVHGYTPGRFLLSTAAEMPFLGDTAEAGSVAYQRIYDKFLKQADEHKGVHTLAVFTHGPGQIFNAKRTINSIQDVHGLKFRVGGGLVNDVSSALGMVGMLKPPTDTYELMSQGVVDGFLFPKESALAFKLIPLIKHVTYIPGGLFNVSFMVIMNPAKYASLKAEDRKVIDKYSGEHLARRAGKAWDAMDEKADAAFRAANLAIVVASPAFMADIKEKTGGLEKAWIEKAKTKGVDGAAVMGELRKELAAYKR